LRELFQTNRCVSIRRAVGSFRARLESLLDGEEELLAKHSTMHPNENSDLYDSDGTDHDKDHKKGKRKRQNQPNGEDDDVIILQTGVNAAVRDQDPLVVEIERIFWVNANDVTTIRDLHGELDVAVLLAYITLLQIHYQDVALGLCNPLFVRSLDQRRPSRAPAPFQPGRVTCLPANTSAKKGKGGHWVLFIVDQRSGRHPTVWLANSLSRVSATARVLPGLYGYLGDQLGPLGWDRKVRSARSPQQREGEPPRRGRGLREPSESNACGLHLLQNMELVARHVSGGADPVEDAAWHDMQGTYEKDRVLEPGELRPSMAKHREALADAMDLLLECDEREDRNDRIDCLHATLRAITPFLYYGP
jgi:hypothetical protein